MKNLWLRSLLTALLIGCVILATSGKGEILAEDYVGQAFKRALITFALVRGINAVVSVVQGTEVAIDSLKLTVKPCAISSFRVATQSTSS